MALRHLGDKTAERFAGILERHFGCTLKRSPRRPFIKIRRHTREGFRGQSLHLSTSFHTGLQRSVLHKLGFTDEEIDERYP
jgi:hypothetical protein